MHRSRSRLLRVLLIAALLQLAAPLQAQTDPSLLSGEASRQDARRAAEVLQDEGRRADVLATLRVIANDQTVAPAVSGTAADGDVAPAEAPVATEPEPVITPLEEGGLIAQMLGQVARWADGLGQQVGQVRDALLELPAWFNSIFKSQAGRALFVDALIALAVVFSLGLLAEWGLRRVLRRPCKALQEHARQVEARAVRAAETSPPEHRQAGQIDAERAAVAAATQPEQAGVALVQTMRDGVERVEAIPIDGSEQNVAQAVDVADKSAPPAPATAARKARRDGRMGDHRGALRHLPFALGIFLLDLLPLVLFFGVAALVMHLYPGLDERTRDLTGGFVLAYLFTRLTMAVVRLLISPSGYGLRVFRVSGETSRLLNSWALYFVALAAFGIALADALQILGSGAAGRTAVLKFISLLAHLMIVMLIFRLRRPVRDAIAPKAGSSGPITIFRHWAAQVWAIAAAAFVMGLWVVWALGVENGFPRLIEFIGVTGGIVVLGRLAAVLVLGALERVFVGAPEDDGDSAAVQASDDVRSRLVEQLYPLVRWLMSVLIAVCVLVALFQAWGFDAIGWFAAGTIGRSLTSAVITIVIAVILALVVWQLANAMLERRIARWSEGGELMRAARLRTLLPMLRTGLMIVILLIVGLTALSEVGINTTPLLAGASIIGVALGFGSQKLVQDFITGIFLLMENAMQVGDWVTVAGVSGTVENLSIRTVRLRAGDGSLHIVPFSSVSTVNNTNRGIGNAAVRISVGYDTDIDQAIAELKKIGAELRADPAFAGLIIDDLAVWGVDSVDGSMVTLAGQMRCIDKGRWGVQREFNRRIFEHFRELGIQIADPRERFMMAQEPTA